MSETLLQEAPQEAPEPAAIETPAEPDPNIVAEEARQEANPEPELILGKFKTQEDVVKSYENLEKRFGGFTGAPESYELPEGLAPDDTIVSELQEYGKKYNMNQQAFAELLEFGEKITGVTSEINREQEIKALGDNAADRIKSVDGYLKNALGDKYDSLSEAVNNAKVVELVEAIIAGKVPARLPAGQPVASEVPTQHDIDVMMSKKDENGRTYYSQSESYRAKVKESIKRMHGID